jgi:hypothetical protein
VPVTTPAASPTAAPVAAPGAAPTEVPTVAPAPSTNISPPSSNMEGVKPYEPPSLLNSLQKLFN